MNHETFEMPRTVWTGSIANEVEKTFKTEGSSENKLQRIENIIARNYEDKSIGNR